MARDDVDLTTLLEELSEPIQPVVRPTPVFEPTGTLPRLAGSAVRGLTLGLAGNVTPSSPLEYGAEFIGSIPSTLGAVGAVGKVAKPLLKGLTGVPRAVAVSTGVGTGIGAGKALQSGDITDIPKEAIWWGAGEGIGQLGIKGLQKLRRPSSEALTPPGGLDLKAKVGDLSTPRIDPARVTNSPEFDELMASLAAKERLYSETQKIVGALEPTMPSVADDVDNLSKKVTLQATNLNTIPVRDIIVASTSGAIDRPTPLQKKIRAEMMRKAGGGERPPTVVNLDDYVKDIDEINKTGPDPKTFIISTRDPVTGAKMLHGATPEVDRAVNELAAKTRIIAPPIEPHQAPSVEKELPKMDVRSNTGKKTSDILKMSDEDVEKYMGTVETRPPIKGGSGAPPVELEPGLNVGTPVSIEPTPDSARLDTILRSFGLDPRDATNLIANASKKVDVFVKNFSASTKRVPSGEAKEQMLINTIREQMNKTVAMNGIDVMKVGADIDEASHLIAKGHLGQMTVKTLPQIIEETPENLADYRMRRHMGIMHPVRNQRAAFGAEFSANAISPLQMGLQKIENWLGGKISRANEAGRMADPKFKTRFFGVSKEIGTEVSDILTNMNASGEFINPSRAVGYRPQSVRAAKQLRGLYEEIFKETGIDPDKYINGYVPLVAEKKQGIFFNNANPSATELRFIKQLNPDELVFYHELERWSDLPYLEPNAFNSFGAYTHAAAKAKFTKNLISDLEKKYVNEYMGVQHWMMPTGQRYIKVNNAVQYNAWNELVHTVLGGPTATDIYLADSFRRVAKAFGKDTDIRAVNSISHILSSSFYLGTLGSPIGGRPASVVRQLFQLIPTYAELGAANTLRGMKTIVEDIMVNGGVKIKQMQADGLLTSHLDSLVSSVDATGAVGRGASSATDMGLAAFSYADQIVRAVTAEGAALRFDKYGTKELISSIPAKKEIKEVLERLVNQGKTDEARRLYQFETLADLQYIYGKANRPQVFRGAVGSLAGMFAQYPINSMEMMLSFAKRFGRGAVSAGKGDFEGAKETLPLLRLVGLTYMSMYLGSEALDADLSSAMFSSAIPHSLAFPKVATDMWSAGASTMQWGMNNLFTVGIDDYQRQRMYESWNDSARSLSSFIPMWGFGKDMKRIIDGESLATMFAFSPLPEQRDQLRKFRAAQNKSHESYWEQFLP